MSSFVTHPSAVMAAWASNAADEGAGEDALGIAANVVEAIALALAFLVVVVEERGPADADLLSARVLLGRATHLIYT